VPVNCAEAVETALERGGQRLEHGRPLLARGLVFGADPGQAGGGDAIVLEHLDRGGHVAQLVGPVRAGDRDVEIARRQRPHDRGQGGQGPGDGASGDQKRQQQAGDDADGRDADQFREIAGIAGVQALADLGDLLLVAGGEPLDRLAQLLAIAPVGIIVAVGSRLIDADIAREAHRLGPKIDEILHVGDGRIQALLPVGRQQRPPLLHQIVRLVQIGQQRLGVFLHLVRAVRHEGAARIHDDGIDQAIDLQTMGGAFGRQPHLLHLGPIGAQRLDPAPADDGGDEREQPDDGVNLGADLEISKRVHLA